MTLGRKVPWIVLVQTIRGDRPGQADNHSARLFREAEMSIYRKFRGYLILAVMGIAALVSLGTARATDLILAGDPAKEGLYVELVKWHAHHMSHPHFHPNDRFITVISGTWWVGTGTKFDPDSTVPLPPGSYVRHFGKQVHYDGAKDEDTVLEIVGEGPATSTPAEVK